jgi:hypothetical protein
MLHNFRMLQGFMNPFAELFIFPRGRLAISASSALTNLHAIS